MLLNRCLFIFCSHYFGMEVFFHLFHFQPFIFARAQGMIWRNTAVRRKYSFTQILCLSHSIRKPEDWLCASLMECFICLWICSSRPLLFALCFKIDTELLYHKSRWQWLIHSAHLHFIWHQWPVPSDAQHDHMSTHRHRGIFEPKWMCSSLIPSSSAICSSDWDHEALWHGNGLNLGKQMAVGGPLGKYL